MNWTLTGAFLSIGLMTNFLSLKEMFRISLQGKPILGVSLKEINVQSGEQSTIYATDMRINTPGCFTFGHEMLFYNIQPADGAYYKQISFQEIRGLAALFSLHFIYILFLIGVKNSDRKEKETYDTQNITSCQELKDSGCSLITK